MALGERGYVDFRPHCSSVRPHITFAKRVGCAGCDGLRKQAGIFNNIIGMRDLFEMQADKLFAQSANQFAKIGIDVHISTIHSGLHDSGRHPV